MSRLVPSLLLLITLTPFATPAGAAPAAAPTQAQIAARFSAWVKPLVDLDVFQGTVLFARGDRIVYEQGFGPADLEHGVANSPESVFRIASLSKPLTEVALGTLIEQGKIALSDPLSKYLPDFPRGGEITIDMLRNHRAGIPNMNSIPFDEEAPAPNTLDSLVRRIARTPLDFAPGTTRRYSNGGYAILAKVIERASGTSYADYMQRAVFTPLGMKSTRHEQDGSLVMHRACGYMAAADRRHGQVLPPFQQMMTKQGGGSLISTTGDLHRFLRAMGRDNVIRVATWNTLFPPDSTQAFQGRCPGYNLYIVRDFARDADVVMLSNNYSCGMAADIGQALLEIGLGGTPAPPAWRADLATDSAKCARLIGDYRAPAGALPYGEGPFEVRWRDGGLMLDFHGSPVDYMLPQPDGSFLLRTYWSEVRFPAGDGAPSATASFRPLWYTRDPVVATRVEATAGAR
jgi:CubicO group peptidase (beta-lactamase class C family)